MRVPPEEFEQLVARALDGLPEDFAELLENVAVVIEEEPDPDDLDALEMDEDEELFGLSGGAPPRARRRRDLGAPGPHRHLPRPHPALLP